MNLDLTGIPEHVNKVFVESTSELHKNTHITYFLKNHMIIFSLMILLFIVLFYAIYKKRNGVAIISGLCCIVVSIFLMFQYNWYKDDHPKTANSDVVKVSLTKTDKYNKEVNINSLKYYSVYNSQENIEFNKAVEKQFGIKAVNMNEMIPYDSDENIYGMALNEGMDFIKDNKKVTCAFNYDIVKQNNLKQIKTVKMNRVVCYLDYPTVVVDFNSNKNKK